MITARCFYFAIIYISFFYLLNDKAVASIMIYDSKGHVKLAQTDLAESESSLVSLDQVDKNFYRRSDKRPPSLVVGIEKVKNSLLKIEELKPILSDKLFYSLEFDSFRKLDSTNIVLKFQYHFDLSKISSNFTRRSIPLISQNIVVRLKSGTIESIGVSANKNLVSHILNRLKQYKDVINKINSTIINKELNNKIIEVINKDEHLFKLWVVEFIKDHSLHLYQFLNHQKSKFLNLSYFNLLATIKSKLLRFQKSCDLSCSDEIFNQLMTSLNWNNETLLQWLLELSAKINISDKLLSAMFQSQAIKLYFSDYSGNVHLQFKINNSSLSDYELVFGLNKIDFGRVSSELGFDGFQFMEIDKVISSVTYSKPKSTSLKTQVDYVTLKNQINTNLSPIDIFTEPLDLLTYYFFNLFSFYKEQYQFTHFDLEKGESDMTDSSAPILNKTETPVINILYGVTSSPARADNASWVFAPYSKFIIGSGGEKYRDIYKNPTIIGHEYFHLVEEQLSQLISENESGALKEHGGDIMGMLTAEGMLNSDRAPEFAIGCGILTEKALELYRSSHPNSSMTPQCMRDFLEPQKSMADQATNRESVVQKFGNNYSTQCESSANNDYCGVHFQAGIPNQVLSQFMLNLKEKFNELSWSEVRKFTSDIVYKTFAGRLQTDAGFLVYGQQLKLECLDQFKQLNKNYMNKYSSEVCGYLESQFVELLK